MWETMLKLAARPENIQLSIHSIGPSAAEALKTLPQSRGWQVERATEGGSFGHGACIMDALRMMIDDDIHVICDSDAFVIAKGWDNLVRKIVADGYGIAGTTYEELGGFSSGKSNVQTYKKVPTFTWAILAPGIPWSQLDVMPDKNRTILIENERLSKIYNLPIGHSVFGEAGYQLPLFLFEHNVKYDGWPQLKPTNGATVLSGLSDYHEEFHAGGVPFVVHHRGSLRHPYRATKLSNAFFAKVDPWIEHELTQPIKWTLDEESWEQTTFKFDTSAVRKLDLPMKRPEGWMKATVNGIVVHPRAPLTNIFNRLSYANYERVTHIRLEGASTQPFYVEINNVIGHVAIVRNMTNVSVHVQKDEKTSTSILEAGQTSMFFVDDDGVHRVT